MVHIWGWRGEDVYWVFLELARIEVEADLGTLDRILQDVVHQIQKQTWGLARLSCENGQNQVGLFRQ